MVSSHDGTCPRDLLQGLVPSCLPTIEPSQDILITLAMHKITFKLKQI